jgi:hypothetical protein
MKFAKATKFHRKSGEGLGLDSEWDLSAVGAALTEPARTCVIRRACDFLIFRPSVVGTLSQSRRDVRESELSKLVGEPIVWC